MLRQFAQKVEELRRLIDDSRSASLSHCATAGSVMSSEPSLSVISSERSESSNRRSRLSASERNLSFLLAVSGGMDSMCMLDLFSKTLDPSEYAVAHCNFSLRGEESDGDQALVEARAAELGVRLFVKRFDTVSYAREHGVSIEMAARELRYAWFDELCSEHGFCVLSVAHNANDNAETLMLNLLRGTGLNGLHGMAQVAINPSSFPCPPDLSLCHSEPPLCHSERSEESVVRFRPLLEFTRKQIEGYVLTYHIPYRHDSSNFESDYKRNRIRNEVFPVFAQVNPSFVRTLNREIDYFAEAGSIVDDWCRAQLPNVLVSSQEGRRIVSLSKLLATPHWRYLLYYMLEPYGFNSQTVASVENLLASDRTVSGKRFDSPTHTLLTTQDSLMVLPSSTSCSGVSMQSTLSDEVMVVRGSGIYNFNGSRFSVELLDRTPDMPLKQPAGTLILDADIMQFPFVCRRWRQGDWLIPLGMSGKKKVSDLFTDLKYDALAKNAAIIMVDTQTEGLAGQQHIAGLLGARIDDRYKVTSVTKTVIRVERK